MYFVTPRFLNMAAKAGRCGSRLANLVLMTTIGSLIKNNRDISASLIVSIWSKVFSDKAYLYKYFLTVLRAIPVDLLIDLAPLPEL
jgi:hypothetical protein